MSDTLKLISAEKPVHLMPDAGTAEQLRQLDEFWSGAGSEGAAGDLSAVSDDVLRSELSENGVEHAFPDRLKELILPGPWLRPTPIALAACLAGAVILGGLHWKASLPPEIGPVPIRVSTGPDPYVLANPDRPAAGAQPEAETGPGSGLQSVTERRSAKVVDLTRAEMHEMQRLLNRLGYGPVVQDGLSSEALDIAMSQFRADRGLDPDDIQPREVLVMLRLAVRVEELRARPAAPAE